MLDVHSAVCCLVLRRKHQILILKTAVCFVLIVSIFYSFSLVLNYLAHFHLADPVAKTSV